jgi:hypothetical protein
MHTTKPLNLFDEVEFPEKRNTPVRCGTRVERLSDLVFGFGDFGQEQAADGVVAALVRVFEVVEKPIVRIVPVKVSAPELRAMNAMSEKCLVNVNEVDLGVDFSRVTDDRVISVQKRDGILPCRQAGAFGIAEAVGRVKDVGQKDFATAGEPA